MMKYPGPKDQYRRIEKRYIIGLIFGIAILSIGVLTNTFNVVLSESTVLVPGPDPAAGPERVDAPFEADRTLGVLSLVAGGFVNFFSVYKYHVGYAEIKEKEPRPEGRNVAIGLLLSILSLGIAAYLILV